MATSVIRNLKPHTEEWHRFRWGRGLGGSDIGAARGRNKFKSRWKLWQEKVGLVTARMPLNAKMEHGRWLEDYVADVWTFYDGMIVKDQGKDVPGYVVNMNTWRNDEAAHEANRIAAKREGRELTETLARANYQSRRCSRVNGIIVNTDYPWLYVNLDRVINKGQFRLDGPGMLEKPSPLECKTINGWHANSYEQGHPPYWHDQGHLQMLMTETSYCEYAYLMDGQDFGVIAYAADPVFMQAIVEESRSYWYSHVIPARGLWTKMNADAARLSAAAQQDIMEEIDSFLPEPDHEDPAWMEFLKERARLREGGEVYEPVDDELTQKLTRWCRCEEFYRVMAKKADDIRSVYQSRLATELDNRDRTWMRLPDGYEVTHKPIKAGNKPTLKVKMPRGVKPDDIRLMEGLGKIDVESYYSN